MKVENGTKLFSTFKPFQTRTMNRFLFFLLSLMALPTWAQDQEPYLSNQTYTYDELIAEYQKLEEQHPEMCDLQSHGYSDYGKEMRLFIISKNGFEPSNFKNKTVILINNAIHPGEPCGVDASVKLSKDLLANPHTISEEVVIAIIPIYNIGGAHNRNCCSRTNQNGPKEYGFRGNAKNLDLNRDFIKADSKNTAAFYKIFHLLNPHIFIDTHTSNGADYQHTMTLITSQVNKMNPLLKNYTEENLNPYLFKMMESNGYPMVPYVHSVDKIPDNGIMDYLETPRYSTGYTNLFNTISYVSEAHMLKSYEDRVESTYLLLTLIHQYAKEHSKELRELKQKADLEIAQKNEFTISWKLDTTKYEMIDFMGYEAEYKPSNVSGADRLFYNHEKPFTKQIKYFNHYKATAVVQRPNYYIIPKAWEKIVDLLKANKVVVYELNQETEMDVEMYYIASFETIKKPYEGHYLHHSVQVQKENKKMIYQAGDYAVPCKSINARFIVETLEPHATDSYLAWNYFDAILQQKEWYSPYVFEDEAAELLKTDKQLKARFDQKLKEDEAFAKDPSQQLYFIFKNSVHYEPTHNLYPIARYNGEIGSDQIK